MVDIKKLIELLPTDDEMGNHTPSVLIINNLEQRRMYDLSKEQIRDKFDYITYCKDNQIIMFKGDTGGFIKCVGRYMSSYFSIPTTRIFKMDKLPLL